MGHRYGIDFEKLNELIENGELENKSILMFGHCLATETIIDWLAECELKVTAVLDNNQIKHGDEYKGVPIISPDFLKKSDDSIVLIATRFFEQMSAQLRGLGYNGQIVKLIEYSSAAEYSLSGDTIKRKTESMRRGKETLIMIRKSYPTEHLVICPLDAIGDVYVAMSFLTEYKFKNNGTRSVIVVNGNGCKQTAEMFGRQTIMLGDSEINELMQAIIYTKEPNCILAHHDRVYTDNTIKYLNKRKMSFEDYYKYAIFGLPKSSKQCLPTKLELFDNTQNLPQGKTVIIAPHAKSVVGVANEYWLKIVADYKQNGYTVCTNISENEKPIDGTLPLKVPLNKIVSAVEFAGIFIGIRSGLCDIINSAKCDKTVIFPNRYYSSTQMKLIDFWGLPDWKQVVIG